MDLRTSVFQSFYRISGQIGKLTVHLEYQQSKLTLGTFQVETPPPEDEMPFTTTPDPVMTALKQLKVDMKTTSDLKDWLNNPETRVKRSSASRWVMF